MNSNLFDFHSNSEIFGVKWRLSKCAGIRKKWEPMFFTLNKSYNMDRSMTKPSGVAPQLKLFA